MNILVTAGNTLVPIDKVRCLTNIFTGRTGAQIALTGHDRGHTVTLVTSHPAVVTALRGDEALDGERWAVHTYRTFDDLQLALAAAVQPGRMDAVIHSAAVSDYQAAGTFAPDPATHFDQGTARWQSSAPGGPRLVDVSAGKVKSDVPELWLRLVRTPKLVDQFRTAWGFGGILVKFKLEVGVSDTQLLEIAERSRRHSAADLMVANTLEGSGYWAYLGPVAGAYERVSRRALPARLWEMIENLHWERTHG